MRVEQFENAELTLVVRDLGDANQLATWFHGLPLVFVDERQQRCRPRVGAAHLLFNLDGQGLTFGAGRSKRRTGGRDVRLAAVEKRNGETR